MSCRVGAICIILGRVDLVVAESPLALIERALQAQGGAEKLGRARAIHMTIKGEMHGGAAPRPFICETFSQGPELYKDVQVMEGGENMTAPRLSPQGQ